MAKYFEWGLVEIDEETGEVINDISKRLVSTSALPIEDLFDKLELVGVEQT